MYVRFEEREHFEIMPMTIYVVMSVSLLSFQGLTTHSLYNCSFKQSLSYTCVSHCSCDLKKITFAFYKKFIPLLNKALSKNNNGMLFVQETLLTMHHFTNMCFSSNNKCVLKRLLSYPFFIFVESK